MPISAQALGTVSPIPSKLVHLFSESLWTAIFQFHKLPQKHEKYLDLAIEAMIEVCNQASVYCAAEVGMVHLQSASMPTLRTIRGEVR